eukprot:11892596-Prorocentrum_lima.AAC.1
MPEETSPLHSQFQWQHQHLVKVTVARLGASKQREEEWLARVPKNVAAAVASARTTPMVGGTGRSDPLAHARQDRRPFRRATPP